jgi:hypothetical protein
MNPLRNKGTLIMTARKLGRVQVAHAFDCGNFRHTTYKNGARSIAPRFSAHYDRTKDQAAPPVTTNWLAKCVAAIKLTYGNTQQGDCVIASLLHMIGGWTGNELGTPALSNDTEALATYVKVCGPGDNGCVIADVLTYAQQTGIPVSGVTHKIAGFASIDWTNQNLVQVAVEVFGPAVKLGINLPQSWYDAATSDGFIWDTPPSNDTIAGGHDVPIIDITADGVVIATWGMSGTITWAGLTSKVAGQGVVDESYVSLSPDWDSQDNLAPNGINATTLANDLALVNAGNIPPVDPNPSPTPTPTPVPVPTPTPSPTPNGDPTFTMSFPNTIAVGGIIKINEKSPVEIADGTYGAWPISSTDKAHVKAS